MSNHPAALYAFLCIAISARARALTLLRFSIPDIPHSFTIPPADCNCLRSYMHKCAHRHAGAKYLDYSAFATPSTPSDPYGAGGWVVGCVYEAADPKLKAIQLGGGGRGGRACSSHRQAKERIRG